MWPKGQLCAKLLTSLTLPVPSTQQSHNTPHSANPMALHWGSTKRRNVPWECKGCADVSYTDLPNSLWPLSRRLFSSLGPDVSGDVLRCCLVSQGTVEQATDISVGYKPGSVSRWKKPGHRANVPSSGGGLGIPRSNQAIHQKGYFCAF